MDKGGTTTRECRIFPQGGTIFQKDGVKVKAEKELKQRQQDQKQRKQKER
jgi:hypothetical protein